MSQRRENVRGTQTGQRPMTFETVVKVALVAAIAVNAADLLIYVLRELFQGNELDLFSRFRGQLTDLIAQTALFGAVVVAYLTRLDGPRLARLAGVVYAASFLQALVNALLTSLFTDVSVSIDPLQTLFGSLFHVTTFLGLVMALRLFQGKTILPGVDFRL